MKAAYMEQSKQYQQNQDDYDMKGLGGSKGLERTCNV